MSSEFDPERVISLHVPGEVRSFNVATFDFATLETLPEPLPLHPYHEVEIYSVGPDGPEVRKIIAGGSQLERLRHQLTKPGGMVEVDDDGWHVYLSVNTITQVRIREIAS